MRKIVIYERLIFVLTIFICAIMLFPCQGCEKDSTEKSKIPSTSGSSADTVKIYFTEEGTLTAILYSPRMEEKKDFTIGWNIRVEFFDNSDSIPDGGMVADSGIVKKARGQKKSEVSVFGNVHLRAPDGTELFSDSLRWNPKSQQIESGSKVKVVRGENIIEGVGIVSDPSFQRIRIKHVKGTIEE